MPAGGSWRSNAPVQVPSTIFDLSKPLCKDLLAQLDALHLLVFFGERGLGVDDIYDCFLRALVMDGRRLVAFSGDKMASVKASDSLVRFARKAVREDAVDGCVVVISALPGSDEMETRRQVNAINRLLQAGFSVVLSLGPEASQVVEAFDVYRLVDFAAVREHVAGFSHGVASGLTSMGLSRGIPQLYLSLLNSGFAFDGIVPISYMERLSESIVHSVGDGLTDEETQFRLYLYLMGSGALEDVEAELGFKALEFLQEVESQSPLFGVSLREGTFLTLAEQAKLPLDYLFDALRTPFKYSHKTIYRAAIALREKDTQRSIEVARHLPGDYLGQYVLSVGEVLLDMGEFALVERGLRSLKSTEDVDQNVKWALEAALSALTVRRFSASSYPQVTPEYIENFSAGNARARAALMFVDMRARFCGEVREGFELESSIDTVEARLRLHANVFKHIIKGELNEAIGLFVGKSFVRQEPTVSSCLLALDAELIRLMTCDSVTGGGVWFEKSAEFLDELGQNVAHDYLGVVEGLRDLFVDMAQDLGDSYVSKPRLPEDKLIQAFMLIEEAFSHMRHGVWTHAHVEANLAYSLLGSSEAAPLKDMARLMSAVARVTLGESAVIEVETYAPSMRLVAMMVARALDSADEGMSYGSRSRNLAREHVWFILLLSNGIGSFSVRFEDEVYPEWRRALASARKTVCPAYGMREMAPLVLLEPKSDEAQTKPKKLGESLVGEKLRINLLGDFSMCVGTKVIDGARLEQRSSKAMLEFLVLHKKFSASQTKLFEQLWPNSTYEAAHERMYQTKSHIRKVLRAAGFTADPFITGRANGTVGLDPGLVSCDVDELMNRARAAIMEKDDATTVELALETESAYAGDLWMPTSDVTGYVTHMASTVRTTYTDALLSGAESAYRIGRLRVASRLASGALLTDLMREDAEMVLLRALKGSGRSKEAAESYQEFCKNMAELAGRPPSKQLRALAVELLIVCEKSA